MATTYVGPQVAPVFVTGVLNDSWEKAAALTLQARAAVRGIRPDAITVKRVSTITPSIDAAVAVPSLQTVDPASGEALEPLLLDALRDFIDQHYPPMEIPDGVDVWERIAASFDGDPLDRAVRAVRKRAAAPWDQRGLSVPSEASEYALREHDREADLARTGSDRNRDIILKTHRKSVQLTLWEIALRAQLDAIEAAKDFLLGCVLGLLAKASQEQVALARYRAQMQTTYWRMVNARIEAAGIDVDRQALEKRAALDADLSDEDHKTFVFRQRLNAAMDELSSLASQATAAINRVHAGTTVQGSEHTP